MKINSVLHLSSEQTWRGGEQQMAYLIDELCKKNIKSLVLCKVGSAFRDYCQNHKIYYRTAKFKNSLDIITAFDLATMVHREKVDLVHAHSARSHAIAVLSTFLGMNKPIVVSKRTDFPIKSYYRYNHKQVQKILCVSKAITEITKKAVQKPERVHTVYSGISEELIKERPISNYFKEKFHISQEKFLIGNTSAIADQKDYFTFLKVAKKLSKQYSDVHFLIMGTGPLEPQVREYAQNLKLDNVVTFTGFIQDVKHKLHELDLFLITSKTEGLGTSILDAFASRVPVVATEAGGIPELVIHQQTGLLSYVGEVDSLVSHIAKIKESPIFRDKFIENALEHLKEHFLKSKTAELTLKHYQDLIK